MHCPKSVSLGTARRAPGKNRLSGNRPRGARKSVSVGTARMGSRFMDSARWENGDPGAGEPDDYRAMVRSKAFR
eukprot:4126610-Alexandrium_andersonii.AAC.1